MNEDRMDFKEFTDMIRQNIRDYLPETYRDAEVKIEDFQKLNQHYLGMQVKKETDDGAIRTLAINNLKSQYKNITIRFDVLKWLAIIFVGMF